MSGPAGIVAVAAGTYHSVCADRDGRIWVAGYNGGGQTGIAGTEESVRWTPGGPDAHIVAVAAGDAHSVALDTDGHVWVTGSNVHGQLGRTDRHGVERWVCSGPPTTVAAIACGDHHSAALDTDGHLWTCGLNLHGQSGGRYKTEAVRTWTCAFDITRFDAVACASTSTFALDRHGTIVGTGDQATRTLRLERTKGRWRTTDRHAPQLATIAVGYDQVIAVDRAGRAWTFDDNLAATTVDDDRCWRLALPDTGRSGAPIPARADSIAVAGGSALIIDGAGDLWANGQLAQVPFAGTYPEAHGRWARHRPPSPLVSVSATGTHVLAADADGRLWVWGSTDFAMLGFEGLPPRGFIAIPTGEDYEAFCALTADDISTPDALIAVIDAL